MKFLSFLALVTAATTVSGHATMTHFGVQGEGRQNGCVRAPLDPSGTGVTNLFSAAMACGANPKAATNLCSVQAGDTVEFEYRIDLRTPISGDLAFGGVVDTSHKGPCAVYMKQVTNAIGAEVTGGGWFKVAEDALDDEGLFCTDRMRMGAEPLTAVIPRDLPAGQYLIRSEILTLNSASSVREPQFYIGCAAVQLSNPSGGSMGPVEKVEIPGYLDGSEEGLYFNMWLAPEGGNGERRYQSYPEFGPAVYKSGNREQPVGGVDIERVIPDTTEEEPVEDEEPVYDAPVEEFVEEPKYPANPPVKDPSCADAPVEEPVVEEEVVQEEVCMFERAYTKGGRRKRHCVVSSRRK